MRRYRPTADRFADEEAEFRRALDSVPPPTPPEGGWGWVVVLASFLINAIVDGICYSYGILLPHLQEHYNVSLATLSLGGALLLGIYMISGPVASALCNKFGSRRIAMFGSFISTLAVAFGPNLYSDSSVFIVVFGICGGVGFGMMFLSSMLIVGFYFERHRAVAATIAMCGSSVGMSVMAPLTTILLNEYQWKGALLILSGVIANGMVLGCLFRPLDADLRRRKKIILRKMEEDKMIGPHTCVIMQRLLEEKRRQRTISTGSLNNGLITRDNLLIREAELRNHNISFLSRLKLSLSRSSINLSSTSNSRTGSPSLPRHSPELPQITVSTSNSPNNSAANTPGRTRTRHAAAARGTSPISLHKEVLIANQIQKNSSIGSAEWHQINGATAHQDKQDMPLMQVTSSFGQDLLTPTEDDQISLANSDPPIDPVNDEIVQKFVKVTPNVDRPMYRKDILYSGSVPRLRQYKGDIGNDDSKEKLLHSDEYIASITHVPHDLEQISNSCCWDRLKWLPKPILDVIKTIFSRDTCYSVTFVLLAISSSIAMIGYYVPFLLLPSYVQSRFHDTTQLQSALLLTALGCSNTVGRILCGAVGNQKWINAMFINWLALFVGGAITAVVPILNGYGWMVLYVCVFGFCVAAFSTLRSVIVVELMGLDKLTSSFSQLVILHGIAIIAGTPIACLLSEYGKPHYPFFFSGACMILSALMSIPLRKISEWERKKNGIYESGSESSDGQLKAQQQKTSHYDTAGM